MVVYDCSAAGKTLLARAIAGEAGVPFFSATGADFEEKYVGVGAKRMRELFAEAKKVKPSIIFIVRSHSRAQTSFVQEAGKKRDVTDQLSMCACVRWCDCVLLLFFQDEIDTVGGKRNDFDHPKARMSLNELLSQLDGFGSENNGVIVMAATNYADRLDPALLRPGRFDRHVSVPVPDIKGRKDILDLYATKMKLDATVDLSSIARATPGMSGADLFHLLNSAALRASALNKPAVTNEDLEYTKGEAEAERAD